MRLTLECLYIQTVQQTTKNVHFFIYCLGVNNFLFLFQRKSYTIKFEKIEIFIR